MKKRYSHILVDHKFEAEDLLRHILTGKNFMELAKKYSKCSSSVQGGDLGYIVESRLDSDFSDAASLLKVGSITKQPVKTKFGYHLILRTE